MTLIGLHGYKQVGKDTIAQYLVDQYGFTRIGFADPLKQAVANLVGITREQVDLWKNESLDINVAVGEMASSSDIEAKVIFTWRHFLQRVGTEMGRKTFGEDFWIERWLDAYEAIEGNVVVTDVRFDNEARKILSEGGYIVEVTRPGYGSDGHASEQRIYEELIDAWIDNNAGIAELYKDVDGLMEDIENGSVNRLGISAGY